LAGQCERCGQTVQVSDVTCWHCGAALDELSLPAAATTPVVPPQIDNEQQVSFTAVAFYAGMTVVCLLLLWLLVTYIRQQPLYPWHPGISRPFGWTAVTDDRQQFTVNLPAGWSVTQPGAADFVEAVAIPQHLLRASAAGINQLASPELLISAEENAFILIYPIESLSDDLISTPTIQAIEINQEDQERQTISFTEIISRDSGEWRCKTHLIISQGQANALFVCQPAEATLIDKDKMNIIIDSFQPLLP